MKRIVLATVFCALAYPSPNVLAQDKTKTEEKSERKRDITPLRVQVVISEYDGDKKISSLPYTLLLNAEAPRGERSSIRMGLRVPVATSSNQFSYMDVGSNLDGWAGKMEEGRFNLHLSIERSAAYSSSEGRAAASIGVKELFGPQPIIQTFRTDLELLLRDGQNIQSTLATDPVSGRVSKVDVTLNVLK